MLDLAFNARLRHLCEDMFSNLKVINIEINGVEVEKIIWKNDYYAEWFFNMVARNNFSMDEVDDSLFVIYELLEEVVNEPIESVEDIISWKLNDNWIEHLELSICYWLNKNPNELLEVMRRMNDGKDFTDSLVKTYEKYLKDIGKVIFKELKREAKNG